MSRAMSLPSVLLAIALALFATTKYGAAQETIFNVPSGDILDKGKVYGEFDFAYRWDTSYGSYLPRVVAGIGKGIELGMNLNGIASGAPSQTTPALTLKWQVYEGGSHGWNFLVGDDLFLPVQNRSYDIGTYIYAELTKTLRSQTRLTLGAFDFTAKVVADGNKAGGQFGIEQPVGKRLTLAADWFTGNHAAGQFTPGAVIKLTKRLTAYTGYEIGNHGPGSGNRLFLLELGWNFN